MGGIQNMVTTNREYISKISHDTCFRCKVKWLDSEVDV